MEKKMTAAATRSFFIWGLVLVLFCDKPIFVMAGCGLKGRNIYTIAQLANNIQRGKIICVFKKRGFYFTSKMSAKVVVEN